MEDELIQEFIAEAREHLATIEAELLAIEEAGAHTDDNLLNKVFRAAHSIKGAAGFFDLTTVKELAHKAETVLDMLRSRKMVANAEITNVLLRAFDKLRELINSPGCGQSADVSAEIAGLQALASSYLAPEERPALVNDVRVASAENQAAITIPEYDLTRLTRTFQSFYDISLDLIHDVERKDRDILHVFGELNHLGEVVDCCFDLAAVGTIDGYIANAVPIHLVLATDLTPVEIAAFLDIPAELVRALDQPHGAPPTEQPEAAPVSCTLQPPPSPVAQASKPAASAAPASETTTATEARGGVHTAASAGPAADDTLRVNVGLLDMLMNLTGELVLSRNQFQAAILHNDQRMLSSAGQRLSQVTSEIQDAIMRTRLQPIDNVFSRLPRVVRDLSGSLGKEIKLEVGGKEVALDRSLVEGLSDPLTHMVRNAIDHGIEVPEVRLAAGKPRAGTLRVDARHEAGQVIIEISDDGQGIDHDKVANAALAKGLITQEQLSGMAAEDRAALILLPGLSTAEKVTQVSGRGVGMDVVKSNLDRLGGQLEITSRPREGTLFRIKLPLTLTIIPALIFSVAQERFAIPQVNVEELLRIRSEDRKRRIEVIGGTNVLVLRERILPLLRLSDFLGLQPNYTDGRGRERFDRRTSIPDRRSARHRLDEIVSGNDTLDTEQRSTAERREPMGNALEIAVITTGTFRFALIVDSFRSTEEIVVKPLGRHLKESREYAGATILGDGTVALIIDGAGLAGKAELSSVSASPRAREQAKEGEEERHGATHSLLLFKNETHEHCAVPLEIVRRIERIKGKQVERVGGRRTMQYRGSSLPLVTLADTASVGSIDENSDLAVIVSVLYGREVGLLVAMPVDVHETDAQIDSTTHRQPGVSGSAIISGETTLLVDFVELVNAVYPEWQQNTPQSAVGSAANGGAVLLAEDSDFFRAQVKRFLEAEGHRVLDAPDGEDAWKLLLENLGKVQVVVTDIEMPRLTGLQLSARIRADQRTKDLPIIAVSSLAGDEDVARAKAAGVTEYQVKLDRDGLLGCVQQCLATTIAIQNVEGVAI